MRYKHQIEGQDFLARTSKALLCDEPGLGKTSQALLALGSSPAIIIAPPGLMAVWKAEAAQWRPDLHVVTDPDRKFFHRPRPGEILISSYDRIHPDSSADTIILDEAHFVKNPKSLRHKRVAKICGVSCKVWSLTGTPITNNPLDLWGILGCMGLRRQTYRWYTDFLQYWGGKKDFWGGYIFPEAPPEYALRPLLNHFMLRKRCDVLDLPPRTWERVLVELPKIELKDQCALMSDYPDDHPIWEHPENDPILFSAMKKLALAKSRLALKALNGVIDDPSVFFSSHVDSAKFVADSGRVYCGEVSMDQRRALVEGFQNGDFPRLSCTIAAAGLGLTLTRARTAVFVNRTFSHAQNSQAEDRVYRIGQTNPVRIIDIESDSPLDSRLKKILKRKKSIQDSLFAG